MIGKLPFKPKKAFVLPKHRFTGPYNPLHLLGNESYNAVDGISITASVIEITICQLANVNVPVKCQRN